MTLVRPRWSRVAGLAAGTAAAMAITAVGATPAGAAGPEQIVNGTFDDGFTGWFATGNLTPDTSSGALCVDVPGGTANPWDAIVGQNDVVLESGETYAFSFDASSVPAGVTVRALVQMPVDPYTAFLEQRPTLSADLATYDYVFESPVAMDDAQVAFQIGGSSTPWTFCLDDVSLTGGAEPEPYVPDTASRVKVNQVTYLPHGPKNGTLVTEATEPVTWELTSGDTVVASGETVPQGLDESSGLNVHTIDFSGYRARDAGLTLRADGETSFPFSIDPAPYERLRIDSKTVFYTNRSGIAISDELAPGYGRPAGHVGVEPNQGDTAVPCVSLEDDVQKEYDEPWTCDYTLDVTGGWYDAGDHGKYVVNGGISVAQLMQEFERTKTARTTDRGALADGSLSIPEAGNGVPDVLDEARWELEWMLKMQVPAGEPLAGMAHHKVADVDWTGIPLYPHLDPQPRVLHKPSTAATLNLAAAAAQGARLWAPYDPAFAAELISAARTAYAAAEANPELYAPAPDAEVNPNPGSGPYNDDDVSDEFYWAAAELYISTGSADYRADVLASPHHTGDVFDRDGFEWGRVAALGRMDLATVPNGIPARDEIRQSVLDGADELLALQRAHPFGSAYSPESGLYAWGSNGLVLNNMQVLGTAYDISGEEKYRAAVLESMDYILGRNALNQSYVTGYGEKFSENMHSRWYADQANAEYPNPPVGTVSGGPNSTHFDPVSTALLEGCAPQFCYVDDIGSWSTNELTINWNAPLSWVSSFIADQDAAAGPKRPTCEVTYTKHFQQGGHFVASVVVTNTGRTPIRDWTAEFSFVGAQRVGAAIGARLSQDGAEVTARSERYNATIPPGQSRAFAFVGRTPAGATWSPGQFWVNDKPCG